MAETTPHRPAHLTTNTARPYHSELRAKAAAETRATILDTAMRLFLQRGYGKVTVNDIAQQANLATPTIYASTGGKAAILDILISEPQRGDPVTQATLAAIREVRSAREVVAIMAHGTRVANQRYHDIVQVMVTAAGVDDAVADVLARSDQIYREALGQASRRLQRLRALRTGLTQKRAADMLWFCFGHESWHLLVHGLRWSWDDAESFLAEQALTALTNEHPSTDKFEPAGF